MNFHAGIDASLETCHVCILDDDGTVLREAKVATSPEARAVHVKSDEAQELRLLLTHRMVLHEVRQDQVCRRLMTAPGVGAIVALTFRTGVDAPERYDGAFTVPRF